MSRDGLVLPVRRLLRWCQLVLGAYVSLTLVQLLLPAPAAADNCSVFTDCFGVANSAVEAAFGLSLLAVLSLVLDFTPVIGTGKGLVQAVTGRDLLTGEELAAWERALGVLPLVGGLAALKYADDVAAAARRGDDLHDAGRRADDLPGEARRADEAPPDRTWDEGTGRAVDPGIVRLVDRYRASDDPVVRRGLSEQIGEQGAMRYLRDTTGRDIDLVRPRSDADVADLRALVDAGEPWPHAVSFGGSRATNVVYFDGEKLIVIEAKGGGSSYGERAGRVVVDSQRTDGRISQTHPEYPRDVASDMSRSRLTDGRNTVGDIIRDGYRDDVVEYVGVRTGGYDELAQPDGTPQVVLEHVFRRPGGP